MALNLRGVGDGVLDSGLCHDKTNMSGALPSDSVLLSPPRWYPGTSGTNAAALGSALDAIKHASPPVVVDPCFGQFAREGYFRRHAVHDDCRRHQLECTQLEASALRVTVRCCPVIFLMYPSVHVFDDCSPRASWIQPV